MRKLLSALLLSSLGLAACDSGEVDGPAAPEGDTAQVEGDDLPLGEVDEGSKADGWGAALTCKPVPEVPRLQNPKITISIEGLTLHLVDTATGYDRVFPIGAGAIDTVPSSTTYGESLTYGPILFNGTQEFEIRPSTIQECKTWWTDAATGAKKPVFAGLPFLSFSGNYAIHGPIDDFTAPNGGKLRRGYVSHGCSRMASADVLEVYGRIKGVARVPVHLQREPERRADGSYVDVDVKWFGSECYEDAECSFAGGVCALNPYSTRGFCTQSCTRSCPDLAGQPTSYCVADPQDASKGICVPQEQAMSKGCAQFDHLVGKVKPRFGQTSRTAAVCVPGSPGWIGDHCFAGADCRQGLSCAGATEGIPGVCTQSCTRGCPDEPGSPWTTCVTEASLGGATCLRQCTPASNAAECPADMPCEPRTKPTGAVKNVCVP